MALKKRILEKWRFFLLQIEKLKRQQICELPQKQLKYFVDKLPGN